jgi:hypothetical protein
MDVSTVHAPSRRSFYQDHDECGGYGRDRHVPLDLSAVVSSIVGSLHVRSFPKQPPPAKCTRASPFLPVKHHLLGDGSMFRSVRRGRHSAASTPLRSALVARRPPTSFIRSLQADDSSLERRGDRRGSVVHAELREHVEKMGLDRRFADVKRAGNSSIR